MKKLSLIAALALGSLLLCSTVATAQDSTTPKKGGKRGMMSVEQRMERMGTELNLTDAQKPKVKAVLEESTKQYTAARDLQGDERRTKVQSVREDEMKKLNEIFTPEQKEKYAKMMEEMKQKGGKKKKSADQ